MDRNSSVIFRIEHRGIETIPLRGRFVQTRLLSARSVSRIVTKGHLERRVVQKKQNIAESIWPLRNSRSSSIVRVYLREHTGVCDHVVGKSSARKGPAQRPRGNSYEKVVAFRRNLARYFSSFAIETFSRTRRGHTCRRSVTRSL